MRQDNISSVLINIFPKLAAKIKSSQPKENQKESTVSSSKYAVFAGVTVGLLSVLLAIKVIEVSST